MDHACSLDVITHVSVICPGLTDGPQMDRHADPSRGTNLGATVQGMGVFRDYRIRYTTVALDSLLEAVE